MRQAIFAGMALVATLVVLFVAAGPGSAQTVLPYYISITAGDEHFSSTYDETLVSGMRVVPLTYKGASGQGMVSAAGWTDLDAAYTAEVAARMAASAIDQWYGLNLQSIMSMPMDKLNNGISYPMEQMPAPTDKPDNGISYPMEQMPEYMPAMGHQEQ